MNLFGPIKQVKIIPKRHSVITGESFDKLYSTLSHLNDSEKLNLKKSSIEIIENCVSPNFTSHNKENNTGLVIGKIQSGKTLSFTTVISLLRDNGYKIVIVISGRTKLLLGQTIDRLKDDLVKNDRYISILTNAEDKNKKSDSIRQIKRVLKRKSSHNSKTIIIPVLKHQNWLGGLKELFAHDEVKFLLKKNSIIIIDDEADQASLNTKARRNKRFGLQDESAIFASIKNLRYVLPNHSYIQYTATPQAPLLIDTAAILSPEWHVILKPGINYTGGEEFFNEFNHIVDIIPIEGNYPPNLNELTSPPKSLEESIKEFLILSAFMGGDIEGLNKYNDRATMLIHPTWKVNADENVVAIETFFDWTQNIIDSLEKDLEKNDYSSFEKIYDKVKFRLMEIGLQYNDSEIEIVMETILDWVIDDLIIHQVTGGKLKSGEEFPWDNNRYHILIGGQLLDRGFTVENLIMTYMPRDTVGNNQADTIEQRCRFYGYRRKYINFCRVYITNGLKQDYLDYNEHEKELHEYLSKHSLNEFLVNGSKMMMSRNLIPTNMSRISDSIISNHLKGFQHFNPQPPYLFENDMLINNFKKKISIYKNGELKPKNINHQKNNVTHLVSKVPIQVIIELLLDYEINNKYEILKKSTILRYIDFLKEEYNFCWVIEIAYKREDARERTVKYIEKPKSGKNQFIISTLDAGDTKFDNGEVYFADRKLLIETEKEKSSHKFGFNGELIIQIHRTKATKSSGHGIRGKEFYSLAFVFSDKLKNRYISKF